MQDFFNQHNFGSDEIFWEAFCNKERNLALHEVKNIILLYGFITSFQMFSDVSVGLKIEIKEKNIIKLYNSIKELINMMDYDIIHFDSENEKIIFLNITFSSATGELRIEIPSVPG